MLTPDMASLTPAERARIYKERAAAAGIGTPPKRIRSPRRDFTHPGAGLSREEYLLRHGPDEARDAILEIRAEQARQKEGDPLGERLDREGDEQQGRTPRESRSPEGAEDPAVHHRGRRTPWRSRGEAGKARPDIEPPPQEGLNDVWSYAHRRFERAFNGQVGAGYTKYGTHLQTFNGRDAYNDFLQEHADGLMYTTQLYMEAGVLAAVVQRAIDLIDQSRENGGVLRAADVDLFLEGACECLMKSGLSRSPNPTA